MTDNEFQIKINSIDSKLDAEIFDNEIRVNHPTTGAEFFYDYSVDNQDELYKQIENLSKTTFVENQAIFYNDYFEIVLKLPNTFWIDTLNEHYQFVIDKSEDTIEKIIYEIGESSNEIDKFISNNVYDMEEARFTSLKIYNINRCLDIKPDDPLFFEKALGIAKSITFEISAKTSLALELANIEDFDNDSLDELINEAKSISKTKIEDRYDKDLVSYYYRASLMKNSQFKYLAYYQVVECIFDEVYLHETIQDVASIIDSGSFSTTNNSDIKDLIEVVNRYSKEKDDRNKTKLVIEKYFKGEVHKEAYLIANKEIIGILKDNLKLIKTDTELEDIQKLAKIIYDFRCECTHSNREYPISRNYDKTQEELSNYIELIKKVSERIILNYR
jgi:hypothetical protein